MTQMNQQLNTPFNTLSEHLHVYRRLEILHSGLKKIFFSCLQSIGIFVTKLEKQDQCASQIIAPHYEKGQEGFLIKFWCLYAQRALVAFEQNPFIDGLLTWQQMHLKIIHCVMTCAWHGQKWSSGSMSAITIKACQHCVTLMSKIKTRKSCQKWHEECVHQVRFKPHVIQHTVLIES